MFIILLYYLLQYEELNPLQTALHYFAFFKYNIIHLPYHSE